MITSQNTQTASTAKTWLGVCDKYSLHLAAAGLDVFTGWVASMDFSGKGINVNGTVGRVGPGIGGGIGVCIVFMTGVAEPRQIAGYTQKDWDFNVSLGGAWGKVAKFAGNVKKFEPLIKVLTKFNALTPSVLRKLLVTNPDAYIELAKTCSSVKEMVGDPSGKPMVYILDTPAAFGAEVSLYYSETKITSADWMNIN